MDYDKLVLRDKFLQFVKIGGMTAFGVLGVGSTDLSMEYSPESNTYKWVTQKNGKTITTGYEVSSGVEQFIHKDDPLFEEVDKMRRALATGSDAEGQIINVYIYEAVGELPTTAPADQTNISIEFSSYGGSSDDPLQIGYTINYNGTPKAGTATIDYDTNSATFLATV